jgi:hypothetical protein
MDASGVCFFYDEVMFPDKILRISLLMIPMLSVVACSSGFYFESEIHPTNESGFPIPEIFPAEETDQPALGVNNQSLINIVILIAMGLVSLILLLMLGRR